MSAADRYYLVERQIMVGRARGTLTEEQEDALLEETDELWLLLTEDERSEVDRRVRSYVTSEAPEDLGLLDRSVDRGDTVAPRIAA